MTTLTQISETQAQKATTANELFVTVSPAGLLGRKAATTSALTWGYFGGILYVDGVATTINDGTVALTNATTNYIEATRAGVVSVNTTAFTAGRIPLYTAVTSGSVVTSYIDFRAWGRQFSAHLLSKSVAGSSDVTLTAAEARVDMLTLTGVLTGNINVIVPAVAWPLIVFNNTTGAFTLTVKTSGGTGVAIAQGKRALLYCDGTNVVSAITDYVALGLGTMAIQNANAVAITGGTATGITVDNSVIGGGTPAAGTFTTLHTTGSVTIDGDLTVSGDFVTANVATIEVEDPLIKLAKNNTAADALDIGFYGVYDAGGTDKYTGLFRDATDGKYRLFKDLQNEPTTTVNTAGTGYATGTIVASLEDGGSSTLTNPANTTQTLTDAASIDWNMALGAMATVTLGAAGRTMNAPTNIKAGGLYILRVLQDGAGNRTITTWNGVFDFGGSTPPTLSTAASAEDIFTFYSPDGTNLKNIGAVYALG